jgi:hypothetical protein
VSSQFFPSHFFCFPWEASRAFFRGILAKASEKPLAIASMSPYACILNGFYREEKKRINGYSAIEES